MILVDSSVWIDHLRRRDAELVALLDAGVVMCHPFVIGELACACLAGHAPLLTRDKRLRAIAGELGLSARAPRH